MPLSIPLRLTAPPPRGTVQMTLGVPMPKGVLTADTPIELVDATGRTHPVQRETLARWADRSVQWLLVDFLIDETFDASGPFFLRPADVDARPNVMATDCDQGVWRIETTEGCCHIGPDFALVARVEGRGTRAWSLELVDADNRLVSAEWEDWTVETAGPVRTTLFGQGRFPTDSELRVHARFDLFAGGGLVRLRLTLHNPRRARHPGGLWDLGDPGSVLFSQLNLKQDASDERDEADRLFFKAEVDRPSMTIPSGRVELLQESSGGERFDSRNHVNREGRVPMTHRGYRLVVDDASSEGLRASPVLTIQRQGVSTTVAMPEFWQQFPKSMIADDRGVRLGVFPAWCDLHELQGGERKTHTVWFRFAPVGEEVSDRLDVVHRPIRCVVDPGWYGRCGVFERFSGPDSCESSYMEGVIEGPSSLVGKREEIDEYGWRNFGEVHADHENLHYGGAEPVVSHYNNQYDVVFGAILQFCRTGRIEWAEVFDPLARHVIDIDLYHTDEDRGAYNGGLFWLTDHYVSARSATHRTYSRQNVPVDGSPYGGGPGNEHNHTTGLLHYYYLTGDRQARDAVVSLADWVIALDDGSRTVFGLLDDGPTGLATATDRPDYQGPGRGAGNSINALLDAYRATGRRAYLEQAETFVRRTIHPADDIASRELLDVECQWSYICYLAVLGRYLSLKIEANELDATYAHARASLLHYGRWMAKHERPYFDHPEQLEYPTETWAAQELRKANALRTAAWCAEGTERDRFLHRAEQLADRAWEDLSRFETRHSTRAVAILLVEATLDAWWRGHADGLAPPPGEGAIKDFGRPEPFIPQRQRVMQLPRHPVALLHAVRQLARPSAWRNLSDALRRR